MSTLLVGFDSAWTPTNSGAIVGVLLRDDGTFQELGLPLTVDYHEAERGVLGWQAKHSPASSIVLIDQPTIVKNAAGQRPVEHIVGSPVSLRYGGMQPANTAKDEMFGAGAPIWSFLSRFGGPADPIGFRCGTQVIETYPVLMMISLGWMLPDQRPTGRLPKYNPEREKDLLENQTGSTSAGRHSEHFRWMSGLVTKTTGMDTHACWMSSRFSRMCPRTVSCVGKSALSWSSWMVLARLKFANDEGNTYAELALLPDQLLALHHHLQ